MGGHCFHLTFDLSHKFCLKLPELQLVQFPTLILLYMFYTANWYKYSNLTQTVRPPALKAFSIVSSWLSILYC